jgi:hypothetical protein
MKGTMMKKWYLSGMIILCGVFLCHGLQAATPCDEIPVDQCPEEICDRLINCRGETICHFKMIDPPACGNLSYAGQDVPCCPDLVRRCGVAFFDMTCDMYGDHSEYNLPICIPCGDGVCGNFENICNCPEDCHPDGNQEYQGQKFDEEAAAEPEPEPEPLMEVDVANP